MKNFFKSVGMIIKRFVTNNWGLKLISLVFAFLVWCCVVAGTNPERIKTVSDVQLSVVGMQELEAKGYCIDTVNTQIPDTVSVNVRAGVDYHRLIDKTSVSASVDLSTINSTGDITLDITTVCTISGANITSVSPSSITLSIDELARKSVPVSVQLSDEAAEGYYVAGLNAEQSRIEVAGPKSRIDKISRAVAYCSVKNMKESQTLSCAAVFLDNDGNELSDITVSDSAAYITVDVELYPTKSIELNTDDIINSIINVAGGYEISGVVANPSSVTIAGDTDVINNVEKLEFEIIDAQQADKSVVLDAVLRNIDGVTYVGGHTIRVYVQIRETTETVTYSNKKIEIRNVQDGYKAYITDHKHTDVSITGGVSVLSKISAKDINIYIDAYGLTEGKYIRSVVMDKIVGIEEENVTYSYPQVYIVVEKKK